MFWMNKKKKEKCFFLYEISKKNARENNKVEIIIVFFLSSKEKEIKRLFSFLFEKSYICSFYICMAWLNSVL